MKPTTQILLALALVPTLSVATQAQEEPAGRFEGEVRVNEVLLDVVVTDQSGNVILGLGPSDFVVEEEGKPVEVTTSTFYSNRSFVESADVGNRLGISPDDVPVDRYFILFYHDQRRLLPQLTTRYMEATRRIEEWIFKELLPNDWVAVVRYDAKLMVHTDFTTDNERIVKAVRDAARGKNPPDTWPSRVDEEAEGSSLLAHLPQGRELMKETKRIYSAFDVLAKAAGNVVGRKNLLLFSMGFGELDSFGTWTPDERYYDDMMHSLNDNNLAVYSISVLDAVSGQTAGFATPGEQSAAAGLTAVVGGMENGLSLLSDDTGGRYFFNFINFERPLSDVLEENNGYYLLSYRSETPIGESGYRSVEVKPKNPDFKVKARQGYKFGA